MGYRLWKAEFTRNLHVKLRCFLGCDMAKSKRAILKCSFTLGLPFAFAKFRTTTFAVRNFAGTGEVHSPSELLTWIL